jgi:hypothetical protein
MGEETMGDHRPRAFNVGARGAAAITIGGQRIAIAVAVAALLLSAHPALAQGSYHLFDRFSVALEGSWATLDTNLRLDSEKYGKGTELDFESDGGLASSKVVPSLSFEWMLGSRHRLNGWWLKVDRDSFNTVLQEIRFGDEVSPIDEEVKLLFDTEEIGLGDTYYLKRSERHAFGVGGGFRTLKTTAGLASVDREVSKGTDFTAPLPYILAEYRYAMSPKLCLVSDLGLFYISIGDFTGSQVVFDAWVEDLAFERFSFRGGVRATRVHAEMTASTELAGDFNGSVTMAIACGRLFVRARL